jgi:hypothetical protein
LPRGQERCFKLGHDAKRCRFREGPNHEGERLRIAMFADPQPGHRVLIRGIDREVEASEPADRDNLSSAKQVGGCL